MFPLLKPSAERVGACGRTPHESVSRSKTVFGAILLWHLDSLKLLEQRLPSHASTRVETR